MKALRYTDEGLHLAEIPVPSAGEEALIRVTKSGICNTDLEIVRGYAGFRGTIGHEFVGVVEESPTEPALVGKRVVGEINAGCGGCEGCVDGDPRHCPSRTVLGIVGREGAHAEYLTLPPRNLLTVPDGVSDEEAVFTEPLAAALGTLERVEVKTETRVAVVGDGKLGLLCALGVGLSSKHVAVVGKHQEKMRLVEDAGILAVPLGQADLMKREFDVVVEASGSEAGFATAVGLVRPRGSIVLKSTFHGNPTWEAWRIVVDEIAVVGSRCGRFSQALEVLRDRRVDLSGFVSDRFSLVDGVSAVRRAEEKGVLKVLIEM